MGTRLEDAVYNSNQGYIDRKSDIQEIMGHINDLSFEELNNHCVDSFLCTFGVGLEMQDISRRYLNSMRYTDLLCVLNEIKIDYNKRYGADDAKCRMFLVYAIADALKIASSSCSWVNLFWAISVKAYLEFLAEQASNLGNIVDFSDLKKQIKNTLGFEPSDSTTIGTLIKKAHSIVNKPWNVLSDITKYEDSIYAAHELLDMLLVNSMETAYPMRFRLNDIRRSAAAYKLSEPCSDVEMPLK